MSLKIKVIFGFMKQPEVVLRRRTLPQTVIKSGYHVES